MTKEQLKKLYNLHQEISRVERTIFNNEFYEWNWFIQFEKLREEFWEIYKEFDTKEDYSDLEYLEHIVDDWLQTFDFWLLTEKEREWLTNKDWIVSILKKDESNFPNAIVKFKDIDEAIDYIN